MSRGSECGEGRKGVGGSNVQQSQSEEIGVQGNSIENPQKVFPVANTNAKRSETCILD